MSIINFKMTTRRKFIQSASVLGIGMPLMGSVPLPAYWQSINTGAEIPESWHVLPIPVYADYGSRSSFIVVRKVAIVRREGGPYQTIRDKNAALVGNCTLIEEEVKQLFVKSAVEISVGVPDDLDSYEHWDTLILLGNPERNGQTEKWFSSMRLSFSKWKGFNSWKDFGREGYLLKVGRFKGKNIILLAGYDYEDSRKQFCGAGTFYALQTLRQLIVSEKGVVRIKSAEIADRPLIGLRGCYTAFVNSEEDQWRDIEMMAQMKANANVYWYGNAMGEYSVEATAKFRYPWRSGQLELFGKIGKWCREHFITMIFCMNADHYNNWWAAPMSFDGKRKDPCHYDPAYEIETQLKQLWSKRGYDVRNDVDVLAAKFAQLNKAVGGGAVFQPMNEDEVFGLIHPEDKKFYNTETGDKKQDAINYGRARGLFVANVYKRVREMAPDSNEMMPMDAPANLAYQRVLEKNANNSRDFLGSMVATFKEQGVSEYIPILTTGGGTLAEVITNKQIDDFKSWCDHSPVLLHENNIATDHMGAYETDPGGRRSLMQLSDTHPAGFRDRELYKRLWGIEWNGLNVYERSGQYVLAWSEMAWMWNMEGMKRQEINQLAVRKVSDLKTYPLVWALFEEFNRPVGYLPDEVGNPDPPLIISNRIAFRGEGWNYGIEMTDGNRLECQRLRNKLGSLLPALLAGWRNEVEMKPALKFFGYKAFNFCSIYLARGYMRGWKNESPADLISGRKLRDLYLEADDIQQRFFAGPELVPGRTWVCHNGYHDPLRSFYTGERLGPDPKTPADAKYYEDFWVMGLLNRFFDLFTSVVPAEIPDGNSRLAGNWGKSEQTGEEKYRSITSHAIIDIPAHPDKQILVRARIGSAGAIALARKGGLNAGADKDATDTEPRTVVLFSGDVSWEDVVARPRWVTWLLPEGQALTRLRLKSEKAVWIYSIEVYTAKTL